MLFCYAGQEQGNFIIFKYVKIVIPHIKGNKGIMLPSVYKPLTKEKKVCEKYIFVPSVIAANLIVENGVSK